MKYSELNTQNDAALKKELETLREKKHDLLQKRVLGQIKNTSELSKVRKDIARILTFLRAKM